MHHVRTTAQSVHSDLARDVKHPPHYEFPQLQVRLKLRLGHFLPALYEFIKNSHFAISYESLLLFRFVALAFEIGVA